MPKRIFAISKGGTRPVEVLLSLFTLAFGLPLLILPGDLTPDSPGFKVVGSIFGDHSLLIWGLLIPTVGFLHLLAAGWGSLRQRLVMLVACFAMWVFLAVFVALAYPFQTTILLTFSLRSLASLWALLQLRGAPR